MAEVENKNKWFSSENVLMHAKKKGGLDYLPWAKAWELCCKEFPDATYNIIKNEQGLPFFASPLGIMVYTEVTVNGITRSMQLPVMDGANRAMKLEQQVFRKVDKKSRQEHEITVEPANMCDINKAVMRCLTKNLAMFGIGIHLYEGEEFTMDEKEDAIQKDKNVQMDRAKVAIGTLANAFDMSNFILSSNNTWIRDEETLMDCLYDKLHGFVNKAKTEKELGDIYTVSAWAHKNPDLVDWCKARKNELRQNANE